MTLRPDQQSISIRVQTCVHPLCVTRALMPAPVSLNLSGGFHRRLRFPFRLRFHLARLLFHPLIQPRFLEPPAVPQLERGNFLFANVFVKRVRTHSQILRRLANVHHFSRVGHSSFLLSLRCSSSRPLSRPHGIASGDFLTLSIASEGYRCPEHISARKNPASTRISAFYGLFYRFSGIGKGSGRSKYLHIVVFAQSSTITGIVGLPRMRSSAYR